MDLIWEGIQQAILLMLHRDAEMIRVTLLSIQVSGVATLISVLVGVPLGTYLALASFRGRGFFLTLVNTGMGLPPVVVGLFVSIMLWRSGPFGFLHLLYTPAAMVVAQGIIASPIVTGITTAAIGQINPRLRLQMLGLGASYWQLLWVLLREARLPLLAAVMAGFGGVISEIGASLMVGGNVMGQTRVLTTATAMETGRGNFGMAIALSIILLLLAYTVNMALTIIQQRNRLP
ncbi:MAG: ABC transporter permease [Chloroflexi bacterium]|nr:ABC transporter permease [Chloroflexota bacterium]MCL5076187.1 ABC transporter permease [Chloroflexota bacterium]